MATPISPFSLCSWEVLGQGLAPRHSGRQGDPLAWESTPTAVVWELWVPPY